MIASMMDFELPYSENVIDLFAPFADHAYAMLLNSSQSQQFKQRFSVFTANPNALIIVKDGLTHIFENGEHAISSLDPFALIKELFLRLNTKAAHTSMGYLSYDLAKRIHPIQPHATCDITLPEAVIGFYDWKVTVDHYDKKCWLTCNDFDTQSEVLNALNTAPQLKIPFKIDERFQANMSFEDYSRAFEQIQRHIYAGDCYEANLCQRFSATYQGSPWNAYQQIHAQNPAPFSAYFNSAHGSILSFSPERFLRVHEGFVETKPIKGTSRRHHDPLEDCRLAKALLNSEKNRAENLMIVDLLRNDLGKSCEPGSINVTKLFDLESFPNVHHLVSTITGKLKHGQHAIDVLRDCFPGGSITGAPKLSTMRIIEKLEPHHRSVYCGSIFHLDAEGNLDSNIAIRTLICSDNKVHCYAGGAIVADSTVESEYEETKVKVSKLIDILESL